MPSPMQGFIAQFMGMRQMLNQERAQEVAEVTQRAQQLGALQQILSLTDDPNKQKQIAQYFGELIGPGAQEMLTQVAAGTAPQTSVTRDRAVQRGVAGVNPVEIAAAQLTGKDRGSLEASGRTADMLSGSFGEALTNAFRTRFAAGMTPGQHATDELLAGSPEAQEMGLGLRPTAPQAMQDATTRRGQDIQEGLGWAGNRLGWGQLISQTALGTAELAMSSQRAMAKAAGLGDEDAMKSLEFVMKVQQEIGEGKASPEDIALMRQIQRNQLQKLAQLPGFEEFQPFAARTAEEATETTHTPGVGFNLFGYRGARPDFPQLNYTQRALNDLFGGTAFGGQ